MTFQNSNIKIPLIVYGCKSKRITIPLLLEHNVTQSTISVSKNPYENYIVLDNNDQFRSIIKSLFVTPGNFQLDESSLFIKSQANTFIETGFYYDGIEGTDEYIYFWDREKERCVNGVFLFNALNNKLWYFPGEYYMWLNYLPIYNKEKKTITFPDVRDVQLYLSLYRLLAELHNKNSIVVKKRQIASSYYHSALLINKLWFYKGARLKLVAYNEVPHLSTTWDYIVQYRDFLNSNTAWIRHFTPDRKYNWVQQLEVNEGGIRKYIGLKSELKAKSLSDDPTGGVGGGNSYVFYEEAGIAPTLDKTYEYLLPSLKEGEIITGQFIAAGSVGSMEDCKPLQKYIFQPDAFDFYGIPNEWITEERSETKITGCFIPQQWGMLPFIDEYGNSLVEEALGYLIDKRKEWKNKLSSQEYQIRVSQEPISLEEVFQYKKDSIFPVSLIKKQILRNQEEKAYKCVELERDTNGKIVSIPTNKQPILEYPLPLNHDYKEGAIQIFEEPREDLPFGTYIAGIDTVNVGKTTTSPSLASIYVMRDEIINIEKKGDKEVKHIIEPSALVCCWSGRYDDLNKTNETLLRILEYYNAIGVLEADVSFTQYVIKHKKVKHLLRRNQFMLFKEQEFKQKTYVEYGFKNTGDIFNKYMVPYLIQYLKEDFSEYKEDGTIIPRFGIERIKDEMVLKEMLYFEDGYNTDRVIALTAAITYLYISQTNKTTIKVEKKIQPEDINELFEWKKKQLISKVKQQMQMKNYFNKLK